MNKEEMIESKNKKVKKKKLLEIIIEDKDGRTASFVYGGCYDDEYVINWITGRLPKLKLGQKLILKPMELLN